ncbi:MAG: cupredoxin domain-containing protein, partial [Limisphaerales bacterium]
MEPPTLTILPGDSVRWRPWADYTYFVESTSGAWETRPFTRESFEVTFTAPGIYTYNTTWIGPGSTTLRGRPGVITVLGWTNVPPRVVLNLPMDGMAFVQGPL